MVTMVTACFLLHLPAWLIFFSSAVTAFGMDVINKGFFLGEGGATLGEKLIPPYSRPRSLTL
jgi:hypothetical protein